MAEWIRIPADALIESRRKRSTETQFFRSPFDVPTAMRITLDPHRRNITIEMRYIGDHERTEMFVANERVTLEIGKHSGRIFRLLIDTHSIADPNQIFALLEDALQRLRTASKPRSVENYDATDEAIAKKQPQILQQLSLASAW